MKQSRIEKEKHKNRWLTGDRIIESSFEGFPMLIGRIIGPKVAEFLD